MLQECRVLELRGGGAFSRRACKFQGFRVFFQGLRVVACSVCFAQVRGSCSWGSAALKIRRRNPAVIPRYITLNLKNPTALDPDLIRSGQEGLTVLRPVPPPEPRGSRNPCKELNTGVFFKGSLEILRFRGYRGLV